MLIRRKHDGRYARAYRLGDFLALAAIFSIFGIVAWYWLTPHSPIVPPASASETCGLDAERFVSPCVVTSTGDGTMWIEVATSTWVAVNPSLEAKIKHLYPDGIQWAKPTSTEPRVYMGHLGYDITRYATDPKHEEKVAGILNRMPGIRDAKEAEAYIRSKFPKSPITGYMVSDAAKKYDVPMPLVLGILEQDSALGTAGLGAKTRNPGNVGNDDSGNIRSYPTWSSGVEAVARWLSKHKM